MSGSIHVEGQTTRKYNLPLSHLDFKYIEKCNNVKELEKIINVLRSGEEGKYPDLERFAEKRLEELDPKSRTLRKDGPILRPGDLSGGDWNSIQEDIKNWSNTMQSQESPKPRKVAKPANDIVEGDENLPPVRSGNIVLEGKKQKKEVKSNKRVMPRDYKEWDKVDIDAELEKVDSTKNEKKSSGKSSVKITPQIDTAGLTEEEKARKADREKDKGNEAFRANDFEESVSYYSRSISLMPNAASFNNRALAYLKLESWDKAIKDCNKVLSFEKDNIKALLRRGTAYKSKKDFKKAVVDLEKVLNLEPNNKKAESLLKEAEKEIEKDEKVRQEKGGGRRMVIEEVESDEEEEEKEENVEHVEVEKPYMNGHSAAQKDSGQATSAEGKTVVEDVTQATGDMTAKTESSKQVVELPSEGSYTSEVDSEKSSTVFAADTSALNNLSPVETLSSSSSSALWSTVSAEKDSEKSSSTSTKEAVPQENSDQTSETSVASPANHFTRPRFIQRSLPPKVQVMKDEGNKLFRSGQYGEAIQHYTKAIVELEKAKDQAVHLSVLLSNRAACNLKTGNCVEAIKDCKLSLQYVPHSLKSLLRRAAAYEMMERYADAYIDYKHAISIDKSADQAHQGASRCQSSLQTIHGPKIWREKIPSLVLVQPWEIPIIEDESSAGQTKPTVPVRRNEIPSPLNQAKVTPSSPSQTKPSPTSNTKTEPVQDFELVKTKGNGFVQKGKYAEAIECYSTCITLRPDQVACYTNRALCYLKLNKANEAASDCDAALQLEPNNPKALYRRALAKKATHQLKQCLQDLVELLKIEPKNTAALKEMEAVKKVYKEELEKIKQKAAAEQDNKVRKRMKIEEVDDDDEDEKPIRGKGSEKSKSQSKSRVSSGAKSKGTNGRGGSSSSASPTHPAPAQAERIHHMEQPVAPPIAPRLMKTTPYEFCQAWNSLKPSQGVQPYADILRQLSPADLPSVISNKLDGQMLQIIVKCVHEEMVLKGDNDRGYEILNNLCEVPRFSTVSMFMSSKEKKEVSSVLDILSKTSSSAYSSADIARLKTSYSVK